MPMPGIVTRVFSPTLVQSASFNVSVSLFKVQASGPLGGELKFDDWPTEQK